MSRFAHLEVDLTPEELRATETLSQRIKRVEAEKANGMWLPACQGTEVPFHTRLGRVLLYCWQPSTGRHAYLDTQTDLILSDEEARQALGTY